ncbi:PREDICTED: uncharacterized protein LOC104747816 [Camelina sativa]|uniref:Uncharacterized protein LOC104747816 n=1 Tax=Camelina sativa TaxID=90675 RepID=A0ABM0W9Y4_CAMSA|nr:PREDICTED: uncharacterized protein LOC104747816 [Camelina sativa]
MAYDGYPKSGLRFYEGLYELVDDPSSDSTISWSKSNKSFVIRNQEELIRRKMLSRFFCRKLTEFISKLKFSGFKQMKRSSGLWEFGDKNFVRGRPELMVEMHKRVSMARITERSNQMKAMSFDGLPLGEDRLGDDDDTVVPDSQESEVRYLNLKETVSTELKCFREHLIGAKRFIQDTTITKDQIRASIRCFKTLIDNFNNVWEQFRSGRDQELISLRHRMVLPSSDDSEELSCDQLRLNAHTLLKFFSEKTFNPFVEAFAPFVTVRKESASTMDALTEIQHVVEDSDTLIYRVTHDGFDGRDISAEEEADDIEW